jgi:malate dehydrogenase
MPDVAVVGAGELGAALTDTLARRDLVATIRLVDETGDVAAGKALDIRQASPISGFSTSVDGRRDLASIAGAPIVVIADRAGGGDWPLEDGLQLLGRIGRLSMDGVVICAGAMHGDLVDRGVREIGFRREALFGSAPEALAGAARAMVALETGGSPQDVGITVLGNPPAHLVVPWEDATIGGLAVTRVLDEPTRRRIASRVQAAWPPGPFALAAAAAKVVAGIVGHSRRLVSVFTAPDDSTGVRARTTALPARLGPGGIRRVELPALTDRERVALDNAMLL